MSSHKRISADGAIRYYHPNSMSLHRIDGPAVIWPDGYKAWYVNGRLHRIDGPAREQCVNGHDFNEYWFDGKCIGTVAGGFTDKQFRKYMKLLAFI